MGDAAQASGTLVVAGLWVRPMATSAARAGWRVVGLDLFGDRDTRRACVEWHRIGDPARGAIDGAMLRGALRAAAARHGDAVGWVAGGGFEADERLLDADGGTLPRIGGDMRAVRDARSWFGTLDRLGLTHPGVRFDATSVTADEGEWLVKSTRGSGGWQIRRARAGVRLREGEYLQERAGGRSMSALFLADGVRARIVATSAQDVRPLGKHPFVYQGAIGPVGDESLRGRIQRGLDMIVPGFGLRGLASADVLLAGGRCAWLEVNPRPSATMVLFDDLFAHGLMHAHVQACGGELPSGIDTPRDVRGHRIVYADHDLEVDDALSDALASSADRHDLPMPGTRVGAGEPLCSVGARGASEHDVQRQLDAAAAAVLARCRAGRGAAIGDDASSP
jgi:predicted ATP-grasp superfamily ATP-dependent carboligase